MDYEKEYKKKLEDAKYWHDCSEGDIPAILEEIFSELKESSDEKIRKALINVFATHKDYEMFFGVSVEDIHAWLEKQGEQKVTVDDFKAKDWYVSKVDGKIRNIYYSVDKIESKFHEGEWITFTRKDGTREILQVSDIIDDRYYFNCLLSSWSIKECDERCHLWTIQDAKDGDVLALISGQCIFLFDGYDKEYCHYSKLTDSFNPNLNYMGFIQHQFVPATKEQRDLLFQKMKEAGYEWDTNNGGLKKIESKPAWSDVDEADLNNIIWLCNNCIKECEHTWIPSQATRIKSLIERIKDTIFLQPKQNSNV